ncbi:hypothetical protein PI124_g21239 [Phytophthora idaei]|nr:hypothetical protein PI126_g22729 [Phytophthora idaei]KAG3233691.1 hypothetical protein PI124_g21239 [Phytophthora idaei]
MNLIQSILKLRVLAQVVRYDRAFKFAVPTSDVPCPSAKERSH